MLVRDPSSGGLRVTVGSDDSKEFTRTGLRYNDPKDSRSTISSARSGRDRK